MVIPYAVRRALVALRHGEYDVDPAWRAEVLDGLVGSSGGETASAYGVRKLPTTEEFEVALEQLAWFSVGENITSDIVIVHSERLLAMYTDANEAAQKNIILKVLKETNSPRLLLSKVIAFVRRHINDEQLYGANVTQEFLAEKSGVGFDAIRHIAQDSVGSPKPETVEKLSVSLSNIIYDALRAEGGLGEE